MSARKMALAAVSVFSLIASTAFAQRICVVNFTGPNGPSVRNQVIAAVCDTADCVPPAKATTKNKPDWKKAKGESIAYFVTGAVAKKGKVSKLTLSVMLKPGKPKWSKVYALDKNQDLAASTLATAAATLKREMGVTEASEPAPVAVATPTPTQPPPPAEPAAPPAAAQEPSKSPVVSDSEVPGLVEKPEPKRRQYFIAIELGADLLSRRFWYANQTTSNLRNYSSFFALPTAKLEFFPLALATTSAMAGLGLEGGISLATWLKSARAGSTDSFATSTMRIDGGLVFRIMPSSSFDLALYPIVGIRLHSFVVGAAADGSTLTGLPRLNYFGLRAGAGIDVPISIVTVFARFVVIPVFASGEIISANYFRAGSNLGLEGQAGLGIKFIKNLGLRLSFDFTRYSLSFKTDPSDQYVASGAIDQYLGGTAALRFEY